jgi:cation transport ATPase
MNKTIFEITKMDCPSEENLIRMKLDGISSIVNLDFDIPNRKLTVFHSGQIDQIEKSVLELNLGGNKISTEQTDQTEFKENADQKKLLWTVLGINFAFFLIEMTTGIISKSMGLVADSLDMLADSFVYGISLFAVGGTLTREKTDCKTCWIFSNNTCDYWICGSFKEIFWRRETSRFFNNDYSFDFRTYRKRNLSLYFTKVKKQRRSSYESEYDFHFK